MFIILISVGRLLKSSTLLKRQLPVFVCFFIGTAVIIQFFIPQENPWNKDIGELPLKWIQIISSFALSIGLISLVTVNFTKITRKHEDWKYAIVLLAGFFASSYYGLKEGPGLEGGNFDFMFKYLYVPMQSTMFSLLAFFVASAAFRAFRAKTKEATVLLLSAIIIMLGRVELGSVLWSYIPILPKYFDISDIAMWINQVFTTAGQRAILLGSALGYIAVSFKILLGIERSYFGGEE